MKKLFTLLALICLMVTGAWADGFQASTVENPVVYVLTNANSMTIASNLTYHGSAGSSGAVRGRFAFISTGETDKYKMYETVSGKYVDLTSSASTNCKSGTQLVSSADDAEVFTIVASNTNGQFLISPTSLGTTYLNFNGGAVGNSSGQTVGFWTDGNSDAGSRWKFEEPLSFKSDAYYVFRNNSNNNYVTYNANANDGDGVNHLANAGSNTYSSQALFRIVANGEDFNIIPAAAPSQYVYAINTNDANSNVGIGSLGEGETNATSKYVWKISQVSDGVFTIVPKDGNLSWNCRGSVNSVNVIGQWGAGNADCRWKITEAVAPIEAGKTYTMTLNGKNVKYNAGGSNFTLVTDTPEGVDFNFTVGGNPADGYTLYSEGASNYIAHTKDNAYTAGGADDAVASPNETAARYDWYVRSEIVYLKIHGTNNNYLNNRGSKLSTWNDGASLGTDGSKMTFSSIEEVTYTLSFVGVPEGQSPVVYYKGESYDTSLTAAGLAATQLTASYVEGFYAGAITIANNVITVTYTALPFQEGKYYTMHSKANANNYVFDGTNAWYNNSVTVQGKNNLWQFEHVDGTTDLYMLKTYSGKYAVLSGSGRNALTYADAPTEWTSGTGATSYFRVVRQDGGFNLQHPGDARTNVGSHVDGKLGSWQADNSATNNNSINIVEEVEAKTYTVTIIGAPEGYAPTVTYESQTYGNNSQIENALGLAVGDLTATEVTGYMYTITIGTDNVITVTYAAPLTFVSEIKNGATYAFVNIQPTTPHKTYYLYSNGSTLAATSADACNADTEWATTAQFVAEKQSDGKYAFKNVANNKYLAFKRFDDAINAATNVWTVTAGTRFNSENIPTYWMYVNQRNADETGGYGSLILSNAGAFDAWGNSENTSNGGYSNNFGLVLVTPDPVAVAHTLNPVAGTVEASELATVTVTFTDVDVAGTIWFDSTDTDLVPALTHEGAAPILGEVAQNTTGEPGVFDITFNTADMEEGEWKLTIPEGAFYILGIGTPNTPIEEMSATYTVESSASQITDLANLSNDKAYVLICERGQLSTSNGQLAAVAKDREDAYTAEANKFAIIKSNDKYYLWSVAEDGYVRTNKTITDRLSAQEITLTHQDDGTFLLVLNGNGVNMQNNASDIIINSFKTPDAGNKYAIYEIGDFADAEKAIAAIPGWSPTAGKVYTIKAHFTSDSVNDLYLSSDTSAEQLALPMPTTATANQSYWVAEASGNADRPWKFKSGYGYAKYLDWQNGGLTANGDNFRLLECGNVTFDYHLNVSNDDRNIGTWGNNNDTKKGFGAVGSGGCWSGKHGHYNGLASGNYWSTDYTIEEVTGVDVYTVSGDATTGVTGIEGYTYASSIGNGGVVIVPAGTELTSANFTAASDVEVIIDNNAKTIKLLRKIVAGTYYMTIENKDTGRQPFLYNSVQYADEITLQSTQANTNGHIWKLTFDGNGTITDVKNAENGKGIKPKSNNCSSNITSFTYERGANAGYYNLINSTLITGGDDRLNASNSGFSNEAGVKAVTTWNGTHNDNEWRFNTVDTEGLEEYNVVVTQPEGCRGYVLYDGKKAGNGGFFLAPADLEQSALTAPELRGYLCEGVTLSDHTISVTYTAATPVQVTYSLYLEGNDTPFETAAEAVTEYVGQAPQHPFTVPEYVDVTYDQGVTDGLIDGTATEIKVITTYNDLMPFVPGELTTVDIDVRSHFYFHVEERTMMIDDVETTLWVPCISPKEPTFDDDAAYIWRMEGDWYNGFRFHNDQIALTATGDTEATNCHITFHHKEVMLDEEEQMEGMKGETSLTEKTFKLVSDDNLSVASRATLTGDADDANSYFDLVYAKPEDRSQGQDAEFQFKLHGTNLWLNFRDYGGIENYGTKDNPDSLLCLYGSGYADRASSFTFHKGEVCTEEDAQAVQAMIDAIEKGGVGALVDKNCQEYLDLQTLLARIQDTTKGCTRALFETYTNKLVNSQQERIAPIPGEAYRLAVRTKKGNNLYLKDDGGYTTDYLQAAVYVLAQKDEDTYFLAGNNNEELTYFMNQGGTAGSYDAESCDLSYEFMNGIEADGETINATPAAMYATLCLTDANGNVATMNVADESNPTWASDVEEPFMNDDYSSAIVMEPVKYTYNKPKLAPGTGDDHEGVWSTIWLPFPMVFPDGVEVYKGTQERTVKGEPYLGLERVDTDHVVPQGGYVLYSESLSPGEIKVAPKAAAVAEVRTEEDAAFVGFTEGNPAELYNTYLKDQNPYVLANKSKGIGFYKYTATTAPMGKAIWLKPVAGSDAECVKLGFDDIISAIEALHGHTGNAEIYDLQGHRLDKVQKGQINVINGQKIMFK